MVCDFAISQFNRVFTIELNKGNEPLMNSIVQQLVGATITNDYKEVRFQASSVKTFAQYREDLFVMNGVRQLDYETTLRLVFCLSKQLEYCITQYNKAFYLFSPENLIVINGDRFVYCSSEHLIDVNPDNMTVVFTCPFSKTDGFTSPEILAVDTIPTEIDIRSIYYGFGALIVYCSTPLLKNPLLEKVEQKQIKGAPFGRGLPFGTRVEQKQIKVGFCPHVEQKQINAVNLETIKGTKLYWFLLRCFDSDMTKRCLLYI